MDGWMNEHHILQSPVCSPLRPRLLLLGTQSFSHDGDQVLGTKCPFAPGGQRTWRVGEHHKEDVQRRGGVAKIYVVSRRMNPILWSPQPPAFSREGGRDVLKELQKSRWEVPWSPLTSLWAREYQGLSQGEGTCRWQGWSPRTPASCPQVPLNVTLRQR